MHVQNYFQLKLSDNKRRFRQMVISSRLMTIDRSWIRVVFLIFFMIEDLSVKNKMNSIISLYYCQRIVLVLTILRERNPIDQFLDLIMKSTDES